MSRVQQLGDFRKNIIELEGKMFGYDIAIIFQRIGHRCGYVRIPKTNKLYGLEMDYENPNELEELDVHGGITYNRTSPIFDRENAELEYWIGFDCAHCYDKKDIKAWEKYNRLYGLNWDYIINLTKKSQITYGEVRTYDYVLNEIKKLVLQIKRLEK